MIEHIQVIPDKCRACRRCEVACIAAHHGMTFKEAMKHRDVLVSRCLLYTSPAAETTSGDQPCRRCGICHNVCGLIPRTPKGPRPGPEE